MRCVFGLPTKLRMLFDARANILSPETRKPWPKRHEICKTYLSDKMYTTALGVSARDGWVLHYPKEPKHRPERRTVRGVAPVVKKPAPCMQPTIDAGIPDWRPAGCPCFTGKVAAIHSTLISNALKHGSSCELAVCSSSSVHWQRRVSHRK